MYIDFDSNRDHIRVCKEGESEMLLFSMAFYKPFKINGIVDILSPVNNYLSTLTSQDQNSLWQIYNEVKSVLYNNTVLDVVEAKLTALVKDLVDIVNLQRLRRWIILYSGIIIPPDIKTDFGQVDDMFERGKTYLRDEYIDLLTVVVCIRFILPIWGDYLVLIKEVVSEFTREMRAYRLIRTSTISESTAHTRLILYIEKMFNDSINTTSSTVAGIGREELPEWLCSLIMVRKLSTMDLTTTVKNSSIITALFSCTSDALENLNKKFKETINVKKPPGEAKNQVDPSFLETYRVKQELPYGIIDSYNVFFENIRNVVWVIDPTVPEDLITQVIHATDYLQEQPISSHNVQIAKWVMSPVVYPKVMDTLEKATIVRSMIASQAILHHWGLHELALLVTGINLPNPIHFIGGCLESIDEALLDELDLIYPFAPPLPNIDTGIKREYKRYRSRPFNPAVVEIIELSTRLIKYKKAVRTPAFITAADVPSVDSFGHMATPTNVPALLAKLLINVNAVMQRR